MPHEEQRVHADTVARPPSEAGGDLFPASAVDAQHDRGNALIEERARVPPVVRVQLGVRVHVDEARRNRQAADVHRVRGGDAGRGRVTHEGDPTTRDSDVGRGGIRARAVENRAPHEKHVDEVGVSCARTEDGREQGEGGETERLHRVHFRTES